MKLYWNWFRHLAYVHRQPFNVAIVFRMLFIAPLALTCLSTPPMQAGQLDYFVTTPQPIAQLTPPAATVPPSVATAVRQDIAKRLGLSPTEFKIIDASAQTWGNACLGVASPAELCAQMLVEGWRVEVSDGAQSWIYHTDGVGRNIRLAENLQTPLPTPVARKVLNAIAKQVRVPVAKLKITEVKSAYWNGCLGIYQPNRGCTKIAIQGWQLIVSNGDRSWVYHLNQDGSKLIQNRTASLSQAPVVTSFQFIGDTPGIASDVIFRSIVAGSMTGETRTLTLNHDGALTQMIMGPTIRSQPVVIKKVSPAELRRFTQLLERQQMPNLTGISYFTSAIYADHPHTTFQGMGSTVQFIDSEMAKMPRSLQQIAKVWTQLQKK
ncbi:MAG: hypothetical protein VKJ24_19385 [Synechococcales bacterium]|nr:hypothetical protein [Synechococcales bacterium]